jgi:hypothetical protein
LEEFDYSVRENGIFVTRNPGPAKKLDPTPRRLEKLHGYINAANDWTDPESFLHRLAYAGYVDGVYASLRDGRLTRYLSEGREVSDIAADEGPTVLADVFGAAPELYREAAAVHRRYRPAR